MKNYRVNHGYGEVRIRYKKKYHYACFGPDCPKARETARLWILDFKKQVLLAKVSDQEPASSISFAHACDLFHKFWFEKDSDRTPRAIRDAENRLNKLKTEPEFVGKLFDKILIQDIKTWKARIDAQANSWSNSNRILALIRSMYERFAEWNKMGVEAPTRPVKLPACGNPASFVKKATERPLKRTRWMSLEEWDRYVSACTPRLLYASQQALVSALRLADLKKGKARGIQSKTGLPYELPDVGQVDMTNRRNEFEAALKGANILDFQWRDWRRTAATWLDKLGERRTVIQHILGHGDLRTTEIYIGADLDEQRKAIEKLKTLFKVGVKVGVGREAQKIETS